MHGNVIDRLVHAGREGQGRIDARRARTGLSYIAGMAETCRPGSSHGNQIASTPIATSSTPTAWPNGFPWRQSFSAKMTTVSAAMTATFITPTVISKIIKPQQHPAHVAP